MVNEISLVVIATVQLVLLILLCVALFKAKKEGRAFYADVKQTMTETKKLLLRVNEWAKSDLHKVSTQAAELLKKTSDFVAPREGKTSLPQVLKWIVQGFYLVKTTKEALKNEH